MKKTMTLKKTNQCIERNFKIISLSFVYKNNYFSKIVRFFCLCCLIAFNIFTVSHESPNNPIYRSARGFFPNIAQLMSFVFKSICFTVSLLVCYLHKSFFENFTKSFEEIDKQFVDMQHKIDYRKIVTHYYGHMIGVCFKLVFRTLSYTPLQEYNSVTFDFFDWFVFTIPIGFMFLVTFQWVILQKVQLLQFTSLRKLIKNLRWHECFVVSDFSKPQPLSSEKNLGIAFSKIAEIYDALYSQNIQINRGFEYQLLCVITMVFVSLTNKTFKILISIRDEKRVKVTDVIHFLTYSIPFLEILMSSVKIKNEAKNVVDSLYQLSGSFRNTAHLHEMIDRILLQIRHEQVECSILGLFKLDGTLFLRAFESHVGAVIVLIQSK